MKFRIAKYLLLITVIAMIPMMMSCESAVEPQDKWPHIENWEFEYNWDCGLELDKETFLPKKNLVLPDDFGCTATINLWSFNCNQEFTVYFILENVTGDFTEIAIEDLNILSFDETLPITETLSKEWVHGTYDVGSGDPPQGRTALELIFAPGWFPKSLAYWWQMEGGSIVIHNRYVYNYRIIIEDADGRTDTFNWRLYSNLNLTYT